MEQSETYVRIYADFLRRFLSPRRPLSVVFDFSNGATGLIVPRVLQGQSMVRPTYVDRELSGNFPAHGPNPLVPKALLHLHSEVQKRRADLGVIFDADGDRAFFADHTGRWVPAHAIAWLLMTHEEPPFVLDTRTYFSLEKAGLLEPAHAHRSLVGTIFMKQKMRETGAGFGSEYSGHSYFRDFFSVDSGILAAIKVINAVSRLPYSLADFYDLFPRRILTVERNIRSEDPHEVITALVSHYRRGAKRVVKFDGFTMDYGTWFLNVRASNTEPLVRLFAAASTEAFLERKLAEAETIVGSPLHAGS